jgi:hypothetical protein
MNNSYTILVAASLIALALLTTNIFNHSYTAFAATTKKTGTSGKSSTGGNSGGGFTIPGSGSSSATTAANSNILTKKELSSFISCLNTANKSAEGLTHKVVTNCLDTARGITPATASSSTATGSSSSSPSLVPSATSIS